MQSPIDILCADERKLDSNYTDAQFQINDYQFHLLKEIKISMEGVKLCL